MRRLGEALRVWVCVLLIAFMALRVAPSSRAASKLDRINHLIVIYQENWSFDSLYGKFPGANGIANAGAAARQVDKNGQPYSVLSQPLDTRKTPHSPDPRFPSSLPNGPFDMAEFVPPTGATGDLVHDFYQEQYQIDGGKMDKFVAWSDAAGLAMSYYDATDWPVGKLAQQYVLADNFFHAAFGDSFLNHQWLICACTPRWPNAPASIRVQLDGHGILIKDGQVTPDGYAITESYTINTPHPANITDPNLLIPNQTQPTIGDRLSAKGISWAWYSGGWKDAIAGHPDPQFKFHHQPFAYFANYAEAFLWIIWVALIGIALLLPFSTRTSCAPSRFALSVPPPASVSASRNVMSIDRHRPGEIWFPKHVDLGLVASIGSSGTPRSRITSSAARVVHRVPGSSARARSSRAVTHVSGGIRKSASVNTVRLGTRKRTSWHMHINP